MRKYAVVRENDTWAVKAVTEGQSPAEFDSRLAAAAALVDQDAGSRQIAFGGATHVKAVGDVLTISGYGILFTSKDDPDLYRDFFTKSTDLFLEEGQTEFTIPYVLYHHGLDPTIKGARLATNASAKILDAGVWVEFQMKKSDAYRKGIAKMAEEGRLGFSTGSAGHLAAKKAMDNGTNEITAWPPIELSLTPTPIESRSLAVVTIKAYEEQLATMESLGVSAGRRASFGAGMTRFIKDYCEEKGLKYENVVKAVSVAAIKSVQAVEDILSGKEQPAGTDIKAFARTLSLDEAALRDLAGPARKPDSIKGVFQEQLDSEGYKAWELWSALSKVVSKIVNAASASALTGSKFDKNALIHEAVGEYAAELEKAIVAQTDDWLEGDCEYSFYLRALVDPATPDLMAMKGVDIEDHSALAVSAFDSLVSRVRAESAGRIKAGRPISDKNYKVMDGHLTAIESRVKQAREHIDGMRDKPTAEQARARVKALAALQETEIQLAEE